MADPGRKSRIDRNDGRHNGQEEAAKTTRPLVSTPVEWRPADSPLISGSLGTARYFSGKISADLLEAGASAASACERFVLLSVLHQMT